MAMSERSSLVTAPNATKVSNYVLKISSKVNDNELVVNNKADEFKSKIEACYKNLNKHFLEIASEYRKCANQSVKGDKIVSSLKKVASNCETQGKYCLNRKKQLDTLYKKAQSESYTNELNSAIDSIDGSSDFNSSISDATFKAEVIDDNIQISDW